MNKFVPLSDIYANLNQRRSTTPAKPFKSLNETYQVTAPIPHARLQVHFEDVNLMARDEDSNETKQYNVEKEWWENVISHYLQIQKQNPNIGSDIKKLFDLCVDKKIIKTSNREKYVGQLDYLTSIMDYIYDITDDAGKVLEVMSSDRVSTAFINFLNSNINKKANIFDWLDNAYNAKFRVQKEATMNNIWQNLRPIIPGQTRGYAGPAEVPIMLFCGGEKAAVGDIDIKGKNLELKANGGRIGGYSPWIQDQKTVEAFIKRFEGAEPTAPKKGGSIEQQVRNKMNELEDTVVDSPDTAALRAVGAQGSFAQVPADIIASAKLCIQQGIITNKAQAIAFIGICQLIDYATNQNFDWLGVLKHNSMSPKIPKMGTLFIMSRAELASTTTGLYAPDKIYKFMQILASNKMSFDKKNDKDGYGISFKSEGT